MISLNVLCFPGAPNLPIFVAMEKGFFAKDGVTLDFKVTPSSVEQAKKLAEGAIQIAGTAFDNVVAYQEGQGAVKFQTAVLNVQVFAMLEREVEKLPLNGGQLFVETSGDRMLRDAERLGIGRERARIISEHVARKLIQNDHQGEATVRDIPPAVVAAVPGALEIVHEPRPDFGVKGRILREPAFVRRIPAAEPKIQDVAYDRQQVTGEPV